MSVTTMLEEVRINAVDYRTCGTTTFSIHITSREGDGFPSIRRVRSVFHCCPLTKFTTHCNQYILQGKPTTLLLNRSQTSNCDLESKDSRVLMNKQIKHLKCFLLLLQDHEIDSGKLILESNWAHNTYDFFLPELCVNSFLNCLSCIILIGSQNTMTLMQQLQYLSAVFYSYLWYSAFQICEPCKIRTVCCAALFFLYPNTSESESRSSKKALIALEGHQDKEPTLVTSWVSNKLHWWPAVSYKWYPGFTLKARISLVWYSLYENVSMSGKMNHALRLLPPPVHKSGRSLQYWAMQERGMQICGIFDSGSTTLLLLKQYCSSLEQIL